MYTVVLPSNATTGVSNDIAKILPELKTLLTAPGTVLKRTATSDAFDLLEGGIFEK